MDLERPCNLGGRAGAAADRSIARLDRRGRACGRAGYHAVGCAPTFAGTRADRVRAELARRRILRPRVPGCLARRAFGCCKRGLWCRAAAACGAPPRCADVAETSRD